MKPTRTTPIQESWQLQTPFRFSTVVKCAELCMQVKTQKKTHNCPLSLDFLSKLKLLWRYFNFANSARMSVDPHSIATYQWRISAWNSGGMKAGRRGGCGRGYPRHHGRGLGQTIDIAPPRKNDFFLT